MQHASNPRSQSSAISRKVVASLVNNVIAAAAASPLLLFYSYHTWRLGAVLTFFGYNMVCGMLYRGRCLGMKIAGTEWAERPEGTQLLVYCALYSASYASWFFWMMMPLDVAVLNIAGIQLMFIVLTGTTAHGYLAGNVRTN